MNHRLTIIPGIPLGHRQKIEGILRTLGYSVIAGGQMIDGSESESDISFNDQTEKKRPARRQKARESNRPGVTGSE